MYEPDEAAPQATMNEQAVEAAGGNGAHTNLMPYQCVSFIVALSGEYPSRN
jgi:microcystin-dependent protein